MINNAGTSLNQGIISAPDLEAARAEIEVNYFGMAEIWNRSKTITSNR
jgi:hypothetical protein